MPTTGECSDHHFVTWPQIVDHAACHVSQPSGHPVPLDGRTDRLRHDETDLGRRIVPGRHEGVDDQIRLSRANTTTHGEPEVG